MRTLKNTDYLRVIQTTDLDQIILGNWNLVSSMEQVAQEEISSYISKRYDVSKIFTNTSQFVLANAYSADALVYVTANDYSALITYNIGDRVKYLVGTDLIIFTCIVSTLNHIPTDATYWKAGVLDQSMFYVTVPADYYNINKAYITGDVVFHEGYVYTALKDNNGNTLLQDDTLEVDSYSTTAIIPGYTNNWNQVWATTQTVAYSVTGIQPDTDLSGRWTAGDNRNQLILQYMMDITLYHLYASINPRNIPELRGIRYDGANPMQNGGAIAWLKRVSEGQLNLNAKELIPQTGQTLYWTSDKRSPLNY